MEKSTTVPLIVISLCLLALTGCSLIVQPKLVANKELKGIPTFDPNDYNLTIHYEIIESEDGSKAYKLEVNDDSVVGIHQTQTAQIKYVSFPKKAIGKCKINNRTYPVLFDTGNPKLAHITAAHIRENKLPIYPAQVKDSTGKTWDIGVAMIEKINFGGLVITNLPAEYRHYHTGYLPFGIPIVELGQDKEINIPLSVMRKFKYVTFDNINNQMEFSLENDCPPVKCKTCRGECKAWKSYPFCITENNYIYIETAIEDVIAKLMVDTGSEAGLLLTKDCFDKIIENQPKLNKAWKLNKIGFAPLAGGEFSYQSRFVQELTFDQYKYKSPTIVEVAEKGNVYDLLKGDKVDGIIGFPFFEDTIMVLDFEREKVWVKKAKGSRFKQ